MKVHSFTLVIDEFANQAMVDGRSAEVCRMLREVADKIQEYGVVNHHSVYLKDLNGNQVGSVSVDWEDGPDWDEEDEDEENEGDDGNLALESEDLVKYLMKRFDMTREEAEIEATR